ncbi:hypothetical protein CH340_17300 [Rhodoplanes serenus]|nr:hypothetical protein CH340_17300 [Rhodoplanes serenus]
MSTSTASALPHSESAADVAPRRERMKVLASAVFGSALEWYDFYLYAQAAALIFNKIFFPSFDPLAGTLAAFGSYFVGFLARPVGGIVFGRYGDRVGRKKVLVITLLMMGVSTTAIGFLPSFLSIGIAAPILLTLCRVVQGLAAGAEYGASVVMSAEFAPPGRRGIYAALPALGVSLGIMLATAAFAVTGSLLSAAEFESWGWRVPFLLSILLIGAALAIRLRVSESPVFLALQKKKEIVKAPITELFTHARKPFFIAFGIRMAENSTAYIFQAWILTYLVQHGLSRSAGLNGVLIATTVSLLTIPLWGWASDRIGRKAVYMIGSVGIGLFTFPFFGIIDTLDPTLIALALVLMLSVFYQAMFASQGPLLTDLFDPRFRFTGIALARETTAIVAGGLAPFIATALLAAFPGQSWPISLYVIAMCVITTVALLMYREKRRDHDEVSST